MNEKAKCKNCTEEMIEEMARVICPNSKEWTCKACNWGSKPNCDAYKNAEKLINEGYRNCKDKVVLTKEEYEKLLDVRADIILKDIDKVFKEEFEDTKRAVERKIKPVYKAIETKARKETAKEIFNELFKEHNVFNDNDIIIAWEVKEMLKELAKQFGVEVENENGSNKKT